MIRKCFSNFVKQVVINCENIVAVRIDKSVFDADKDVLLVASCCTPRTFLFMTPWSWKTVYTF